MAHVFGAMSSTEDVLSGANLQGKRVLVTDVSAGIGVETARSLALMVLRFWVQHAIWPRPKRRQPRCERTLRLTMETSSWLSSILPTLRAYSLLLTTSLGRLALWSHERTYFGKFSPGKLIPNP